MTQVLRISWTGWCSSMLLMGILVVLASLPPWVGEPVRIALMYGFDPLCHQIAERSPHVHGVQLAVCHRCYGILIGLAIGPIAALIIQGRGKRYASLLIIASLVPLALDWGLGIVGIWANTAASRLITGAIFGVAAGILVANAMAWYRPSTPL
ncbi:MAG: DUF2085 domain-containing protein [Bacteroidota bacterium]|nr:DUF2085 domain-containing protein [Bacteroidota bacterium]